MRQRLVIACGIILCLVFLDPPDATAQTGDSPATAPPERAQESAARSTPSKLWMTAGATFATMRGDCQTCEEDFPYRHAAGLLANIGYRANERMNVGAEVFWIPADSPQGQIRTTHIDAVAQFRPWAGKGFFLKGGAGMAFVRNWVDSSSPDPIRQKALSVVIGTGWAFRSSERIGLQIFGSQHVAALGDFQMPHEEVPDVVGNFWSLGVAIVIR